MKGTVLYQAYALMNSSHHIAQKIKSIHSVTLPVAKIFIHWESGVTEEMLPQHLGSLAEFVCRDCHPMDAPEVDDDALDVKWRDEVTGAWMCIHYTTHEVLQWMCEGWRNENEDIERITRAANSSMLIEGRTDQLLPYTLVVKSPTTHIPSNEHGIITS